nr:hypothetical protein [Streptomyces brevispora]
MTRVQETGLPQRHDEQDARQEPPAPVVGDPSRRALADRYERDNRDDHQDIDDPDMNASE